MALNRPFATERRKIVSNGPKINHGDASKSLRTNLPPQRTKGRKYRQTDRRTCGRREHEHGGGPPRSHSTFLRKWIFIRCVLLFLISGHRFCSTSIIVFHLSVLSFAVSMVVCSNSLSKDHGPGCRAVISSWGDSDPLFPLGE